MLAAGSTANERPRGHGRETGAYAAVEPGRPCGPATRSTFPTEPEPDGQGLDPDPIDLLGRQSLTQRIELAR